MQGQNCCLAAMAGQKRAACTSLHFRRPTTSRVMPRILFFSPVLHRKTNQILILFLNDRLNLFYSKTPFFCFFSFLPLLMVVDLMGHTQMDDQIAIQEAMSAGLRNMERLIYLLSHQNHTQAKGRVNCREITDSTVSKFKKVISILNRTGHARFHRGPVMQTRSEIPMLPASAQAATTQSQTLTLDFSKPCLNHGSEISNNHFSKESFSISPPISSANSSFMSSITGDGSVSVSNGKQGSSLLLVAALAVSAGKPPLSSSYKKKCHGHGHSEDLSGKYSLSGRCRCSKKRFFPHNLLSSPESSLSSYLEGESPAAAVNLWHCHSFRKS